MKTECDCLCASVLPHATRQNEKDVAAAMEEKNAVKFSPRLVLHSCHLFPWSMRECVRCRGGGGKRTRDVAALSQQSHPWCRGREGKQRAEQSKLWNDGSDRKSAAGLPGAVCTQIAVTAQLPHSRCLSSCTHSLGYMHIHYTILFWDPTRAHGST